jgi:hypothetical protein
VSGTTRAGVTTTKGLGSGGDYLSHACHRDKRQ